MSRRAIRWFFSESYPPSAATSRTRRTRRQLWYSSGSAVAAFALGSVLPERREQEMLLRSVGP